jgi:hypothetical protein
MKRFIQLRQGLVAAAAALLLAAPASAAIVSPTKANGDFIAGTGIPADNFTVASAGGDAVALKGRLRNTGQPLSQSGNIYYVPTGLAPDNVNPAWSVDYQFTPEDGADDPTLLGSDYWLTLDVDFDPTYGSANFKSLSGLVVNGLVSGLQFNPGAGGWSNDTTPWVVSESTNLGFGFWALVPPLGPTGYDPNVVGEYEVRLTVSEVDRSGFFPARGADIVGTDILVRAIPEPASAALAGVAALGLFVARRRRLSV